MTITIETRISLGFGRSRSLCLMFDPEAQSKYYLFFTLDEDILPNALAEPEPQP